MDEEPSEKIASFRKSATDGQGTITIKDRTSGASDRKPMTKANDEGP
jgi:hypothetical protein